MQNETEKTLTAAEIEAARIIAEREKATAENAAMRAKYPGKDIRKLTAYNEAGEAAVAWVRKPERSEIAPYIAVLEAGRRVDASEMLLNTIWLEGDERVKTEDEFFYSVMYPLGEIIKIRQASLEKI